MLTDFRGFPSNTRISLYHQYKDLNFSIIHQTSADESATNRQFPKKKSTVTEKNRHTIGLTSKSLLFLELSRFSRFKLELHSMNTIFFR